ncbi:hypothetical protein BG004_003993 [Podila humilis]|nr:hypothetical protein BG004_003993 [Podila humilis]
MRPLAPLQNRPPAVLQQHQQQQPQQQQPRPRPPRPSSSQAFHQPGRPAAPGRPHPQGRPPGAHVIQPGLPHPRPASQFPFPGARPPFARPYHNTLSRPQPPSLQQSPPPQRPNMDRSPLLQSQGLGVAQSPTVDTPRSAPQSSNKIVHTSPAPAPAPSVPSPAVNPPREHPLEQPPKLGMDQIQLAQAMPVLNNDLPSADVLFGGPSTFDLFHSPPQKDVAPIPEPTPAIQASSPAQMPASPPHLGEREQTLSRSNDWMQCSLANELVHGEMSQVNDNNNDTTQQHPTLISTEQHEQPKSDCKDLTSAASSELFPSDSADRGGLFEDGSDLFAGAETLDTSQLFGNHSTTDSSHFFSEMITSNKSSSATLTHHALSQQSNSSATSMESAVRSVDHNLNIQSQPLNDGVDSSFESRLSKETSQRPSDSFKFPSMRDRGNLNSGSFLDAQTPKVKDMHHAQDDALSLPSKLSVLATPLVEDISGTETELDPAPMSDSRSSETVLHPDIPWTNTHSDKDNVNVASQQEIPWTNTHSEKDNVNTVSQQQNSWTNTHSTEEKVNMAPQQEIPWNNVHSGHGNIDTVPSQQIPWTTTHSSEGNVDSQPDIPWTNNSTDKGSANAASQHDIPRRNHPSDHGRATTKPQQSWTSPQAGHDIVDTISKQEIPWTNNHLDQGKIVTLSQPDIPWANTHSEQGSANMSSQPDIPWTNTHLDHDNAFPEYPSRLRDESLQLEQPILPVQESSNHFVSEHRTCELATGYTESSERLEPHPGSGQTPQPRQVQRQSSPLESENTIPFAESSSTQSILGSYSGYETYQEASPTEPGISGKSSDHDIAYFRNTAKQDGGDFQALQPHPVKTISETSSAVTVDDRSTSSTLMYSSQHHSLESSERDPVNYSIMELPSVADPSHFFTQHRQSPLLRGHLELASPQNVPQPAAMFPNENDATGFDMISLGEDPSNSVLAPTLAETTPAPQKERGLASIFDPATLGAVEDLLNMPKSAAFERGMNRLFKGVKSGATSMFTTSLAHPQRDTDATSASPSSTMHAEPQTEQTATVEHHLLKSSGTRPKDQEPIGGGSASETRTLDEDTNALDVGGSRTENIESNTPPPPNPTVFLPPPPRANPNRAKSPKSPKLDIKSHRLARSAPQFDWTPQQPLFLSEDGDQSLNTTQHLSQPVDVPSVDTPLVVENQEEHHGLEQGLSKLFGGFREAWRGADRQNTATAGNADYAGVIHQEADSSALFQQPTDTTSGPSLFSFSNSATRSSVEHQTHPLEAGNVTSPEPQPQVNQPKRVSIVAPLISSPPAPEQRDFAVQPPYHSPQAPSPDLDISSIENLRMKKPAADDLRSEQYPSIQRVSSPSVLDSSVLLRKQSVVSAVLAEQQASSSTLRANPDTKGKLLEKARGILEKRQRISGQHHQQQQNEDSPSVHSSQSPVVSVDENQHRELETGHSMVDSRTPHGQKSGHLQWSEYPSRNDAEAASPRENSQFISPTTLPPFIEPEQHIVKENEDLKLQIEHLSAELELAKQSADMSRAQQDDLQREATRLRVSMHDLEERHRNQSAKDTTRLLALETTISEVYQELEDAKSRFMNATSLKDADSARIKYLLDENQRLSYDLNVERSNSLVKNEASAGTDTNIDTERIAELEDEIRNLRSELELSQRQIQEQRAQNASQVAAASAAAAAATAASVSITSDGMSYTPEQLSTEAEGLRRQLKGQRADIKEMQDTVKQVENEKRQLLHRIEQLEASLSDAERRRKEEKSHSVMKDNAFKDIQERLVAAFELEKAQYIDEESLKYAKLEYRYGNLEEENQKLQGQLASREQETADDNMMREDSERERERSLESLLSQNKILQNELDEARSAITHYREKEEDLGTTSRLPVLEEKLIQTTETTTMTTLCCEATQRDLDEAKRELEAFKTIVAASAKESIDAHHRHDEYNDLLLRHNHLLEEIDGLKEGRIMAQEEKAMVEVQLQRAENQLAAMRTELQELEAAGGVNSAEEHDSELQELTSALEDMRTQLRTSERLHAEHIARLEAASGNDHSKLQASVETARQQLEQEQAVLSRTQQLMQDKQREMENLAIELDSSLYNQGVCEKENQELRSQLEASRQQQREQLSSNAEKMELDRETSLQEMGLVQRELQARLEETDARVKTMEIEHDMVTQELALKLNETEVLSTQIEALHDVVKSERKRASENQDGIAQLMTLCSSMLQASMSGNTPQLPKDLVALAGGQSVEPILNVFVRLRELQQAEQNHGAQVESLKSELQELRLRRSSTSGISGSGDKKPGDIIESTFNTEQANDGTEVLELKEKVKKMEDGILKLQRFLQEFQDEKKKAMLVLEQQLAGATEEVASVRSELAMERMARLKGEHMQRIDIDSDQLQSMLEVNKNGGHQTQSPSSLSSGHQRDIENISDTMIRLKQQNSELDKTLLDLKHRYERSQTENDRLLSQLEDENQKLRSKAERLSPDMASEHLEKIQELESELAGLHRQLQTAHREREFMRQDMRSLKVELARLRKT